MLLNALTSTFVSPLQGEGRGFEPLSAHDDSCRSQVLDCLDLASGACKRAPVSGEATALRVRDLDLLRRRARIAENSAELAGRKLDPAETKTGRVRVVPLFTDLAEELAAHIEKYGVRKPNGEVVRFGRTTGRSRVFQPAAVRAGVVRPGDGASWSRLGCTISAIPRRYSWRRTDTRSSRPAGSSVTPR
jgi:integrase